ncbi:MAG: phosphatidylinositol mannoside acyltransferase [Acidimicrobiales bacterium]
MAPTGRHPALKLRLPVDAYFGYRAGAGLARVVPRRVAEAVASHGGRAVPRVMKARREIAERHLRRVYGPHVSEAELARQVRQTFASYARYWAESFRLAQTSPAELDAGMSTEGIGHVDRARAAGHGVIVALPHLGGWDAGGAWFTSVGYPMTVVVEAVEPPELFEWFCAERRARGLEVVALGADAGVQVLRRLRANGVVALVCDRDITGGGVEVEFFGERTTLPSGPATLALRTGAALLPTAVYFEGRRGHRAVVRPPLPTERQGRFREDVARVTQLLADELEGLIRRAPDQWHLFQPNWPSDPGYTR